MLAPAKVASHCVACLSKSSLEKISFGVETRSSSDGFPVSSFSFEETSKDCVHRVERSLLFPINPVLAFPLFVVSALGHFPNASSTASEQARAYSSIDGWSWETLPCRREHNMSLFQIDSFYVNTVLSQTKFFDDKNDSNHHGGRRSKKNADRRKILWSVMMRDAGLRSSRATTVIMPLLR